MSASKRDLRLRQAQSHWRLASKYRKAGNYAAAGLHQTLGDQRFKEFERERAARERRRGR